MHFDHVALASRDSLPALDFLVGELGATVLQGAEQPGFRPLQLRVGDARRGMTVELLEPWLVEESDFLERFLASRGAGPHHITFKVDDLERELVRVRAEGIEPTGVRIDSDQWKEAFLPPKASHGTVIQLAQAGPALATPTELFQQARTVGPHEVPRWWPEPPPRAEATAVLERVVVSTPTLDATCAFYSELLRGTVVARSASSADVQWNDGGCVRVIEDTTREPGVVRLEVAGDGPPRQVVLSGTPFVIGG